MIESCSLSFLGKTLFVKPILESIKMTYELRKRKNKSPPLPKT